jgi:hypothetical protein
VKDSSDEAEMRAMKSGKNVPAKEQQRSRQDDKLLQQRVPEPSGQSRTTEGASTGKSAKSTAGGAAGQLTAKD